MLIIKLGHEVSSILFGSWAAQLNFVSFVFLTFLRQTEPRQLAKRDRQALPPHGPIQMMDFTCSNTVRELLRSESRLSKSRSRSSAGDPKYLRPRLHPLPRLRRQRHAASRCE